MLFYNQGGYIPSTDSWREGIPPFDSTEVTFMSYKTICETDADFLLYFKYLENDGFVFTYVKKENNIFKSFVNCNGKIFGPFDRVTGPYGYSPSKGEWTAYKDDLILEYSDNGNECKTTSTNGISVASKTKADIPFSVTANGKTTIPEEFYNPGTHVLRLCLKNKQCFVTDKKRYGPYYTILDSEYFDEEHFHFTYRKRKYSKRWYYNCNGKEIGPFFNPGGHLHCDKHHRLILNELGDGNFIFINGEKIKCFDAPYRYCKIYNYNGHEIIIGEDTDRNVYFKRDEIESEFSAGIVLPLDNGDVVYSKKENDTETWFYNDIPISISVRGKDSKIYNSIIKYTRTDSKESPNISYFMLKGKEYNGIVLESFCKGYIIWLENGSILSAPYNFTLVHPRFEHNCFYANDNYEQERTGNFLRLFYTHRLAGRD